MIFSNLLRWSNVALLLPLITLSCKLDTLLYEPHTTPEQWCQLRPCINFAGTIVNEPLGSFLVFLLAFLWIGAGIYFLKRSNQQKSRVWFGIALVLGGLGAAQAGISYQTFSYALKCQGREFCALTNAFEVGYSLTQALSVSAMLGAVALACTQKILRKALFVYSILNAIIYVLVVMRGLTELSRFLLSFEVLMLFALPGILFVLCISGVRYAKTRSSLSGSLLLAAVLLILVQIAYFGYFGAGITAQLYQKGKGFYFSENDVLHVGMILWLIYVVKVVGKHLKDFEHAD